MKYKLVDDELEIYTKDCDLYLTKKQTKELYTFLRNCFYPK